MPDSRDVSSLDFDGIAPNDARGRLKRYVEFVKRVAEYSNDCWLAREAEALLLEPTTDGGRRCLTA